MNMKIWFWTAVELAAYLAIIFLLVGGSIWLELFLSGVVAFAIYLNGRLIENRRLFDIADAELVRVSALANGLEVKASLLQEQLEQAESRIASLEFKFDRT